MTRLPWVAVFSITLYRALFTSTGQWPKVELFSIGSFKGTLGAPGTKIRTRFGQKPTKW